jgi:hypothetical protein
LAGCQRTVSEIGNVVAVIIAGAEGMANEAITGRMVPLAGNRLIP